MKTPALPPTDHQPRAYTGPSADEVLALRKQFMNPGIFLYYKKPLMVVEGHRQYVWDEKGKRYLDGLGGIVTVSVGHCHPHVIAAGNEQNETSSTPPRFISIPTWRNTRRNSRRKCPAI